MDKENTEPIVLVDLSGEKIVFDQITVIPHIVDGKERLYAILKPYGIRDVADDEAMVFFIAQDSNGVNVLKVETDQHKAINIFDEYYDLIDELKSKKKKAKS